MTEMTTIALDAMGGDNAPGEIVKGALKAVHSRQDIQLLLTGDEAVLGELLKGREAASRISIVPATEVIETAEHPVMAIRKKKDSSLVVGLKLVAEGKADAFISAGNSGAVLAGGQAFVGRIKGVQRPPLAPLIPTQRGVCLLLDCGANVDARPSHLVQFATMGTLYMKHVLGISDPTVGLVNIGAEEEKGNALVKETYPLLKQQKNIHFVGNVEAREIPEGAADIVLCEAFVGNVILKLYEGLGKTLFVKIKQGLLKSFRSKLGAILVKPALRETLKEFDAGEYGGAPMLGLTGLVVKIHGNATWRDVYHAVGQCVTFKEQDLPGKMTRAFAEEEPGSVAPKESQT